MANTDVFDLGEALLNVIAARFAAAAVGLPARRYVHAGEWALDCEQLVVAFQGLHMGVPGRASTDPALQAVIVSATFEVAITRCIPTGRTAGNTWAPPAAADLQGAAAQIITDGWVLQKGMLAALREGTFDGACGQVVLGALTPIDPQGAYSGIRLPVTADMA